MDSKLANDAEPVCSVTLGTSLLSIRRRASTTAEKLLVAANKKKLKKIKKREESKKLPSFLLNFENEFQFYGII